MIWKLNKFKNLIKMAYNGTGLTVGKNGKDYILATHVWMMMFREEAFAKEYKAAVIEYTGELPEAGEVFLAKKGEANQYELREVNDWIREKYVTVHKMKEVCTVTPVFILHKGTVCRVLARGEQTELITYEYLDAIEPGAVDQEVGETPVVGPMQKEEDMGVVYFSSNMCYFKARTRHAALTNMEHEVLDALKQVDFGVEED